VSRAAEAAALRAEAKAYADLARAKLAQADAIEHAAPALVGASSSPWVLVRACAIPPTTRKRLTREGKLATAKVGRDLMVRRDDVDAWIESQRIQPPEGDEMDRVLRLVGRKGAR
jgi:excisionase family DNA binding protein